VDEARLLISSFLAKLSVSVSESGKGKVMSIESYELARLGAPSSQPLPARYRAVQLSLYALAAALVVLATLLGF
jgi:hypothetical protein